MREGDGVGGGENGWLVLGVGERPGRGGRAGAGEPGPGSGAPLTSTGSEPPYRALGSPRHHSRAGHRRSVRSCGDGPDAIPRPERRTDGTEDDCRLSMSKP